MSLQSSANPNAERQRFKDTDTSTPAPMRGKKNFLRIRPNPVALWSLEVQPLTITTRAHFIALCKSRLGPLAKDFYLRQHLLRDRSYCQWYE